MTEDQARYRKHLFSVRVWLEDLADGQIEWRGQVQYVPNGEVRYFRGWPSLAAIMQAMLPNATTDPFGPLQPKSGEVASEPNRQRTTGAGTI